MSEIPLMLTDKHKQALQDRAISAEFALASGIRSLMDNESRRLGFESSLTLDERKHGLQGIGIPFAGSNGDGTTWRLRPDNIIVINGKPAKYLSRKGDRPRPFYPHTTVPEYKPDSSVEVIVTESELKAVAIAESMQRRNLKVAVIGIQGINGGWIRPRKVVEKPDGTREAVKDGPPQLISELLEWNWRERTVLLANDSDVASTKHAEAYQKCRTSGAIGAEATFAHLLRRQGAAVWIVELPNELDGSKNGADDFLARYGDEAFEERLRKAVNERDIQVLLCRALICMASEALKPQPEINWIIRGMYQPGTVNADVGDAGTLKTYKNIDMCVCIALGKPWLGISTRRERVLIVDEESGPKRLPMRIGDTMRGHGAPADLSLGYVSLLGLNLRIARDLDRLRALIDSFEAGFVLIDSWAAIVAGADENAVAEMQPILTSLRRIAERTKCAIQLIHHANRSGAYRGTTAFKAALDLMMLYERRPGNQLLITCEKARDAAVEPISAVAHFELGRFYLTPLVTNIKESLSASQAYVLGFLELRDHATIGEIMDAAEICSPEAARKAVYDLAKKNLIKRTDQGGRGESASYSVVKF